ncbi:hypothetical protein [Blastococcus deserti]|uniref:Uncharacterized protein n=1 Tax=Blastococcus deserti TaxID=2259033 RepID=A0ABW4XF04_9ACTN
MRRSHVVLTGIAVAGAAVTGSAFTAANVMPSTTVAGYGQTSVTGATVTDIDFLPYTADNTDVGSVTFNSSTNVGGKTASLTLKQGTTVIGTFTCDTTGAYNLGTMDIVCDASSTHPDFDSFNFVGLTVLD